MQPLIIVGAGGFGRELFQLVQEINAVRPRWNILGFLDDNPAALADKLNYPPILGGIGGSLPVVGGAEPLYACALGMPPVRKKVVAALDSRGVHWATLKHPLAVVGPNSVLGDGCILARAAIVTADVTLGRHVHMNLASTVGHDARVGDFCTFSPHADVTGAAILEEGVFLGSHASVLPRSLVGAWAKVGAGSVVLRHVKPGQVVMGVPAKEVLGSVSERTA